MTNQPFAPAADATTASTSSPTARKQAQTTSTPAHHWQTRFLEHIQQKQGASEYLFHLLELIEDAHGMTDPTPLLCEMLDVWACNTHSPDRHAIGLFARHIAFLNKLRTYFECFEIDSDYSTWTEEGEGHA